MSDNTDYWDRGLHNDQDNLVVIISISDNTNMRVRQH